MSFLTRSGGSGGGGGTVTSVGATLPLQSSGGTTPVISIADGTTAGQVQSWSGTAWNTAERVLRGLGMTGATAMTLTATTGTAALVSTAGATNVTAATNVTLTAPNQLVLLGTNLAFMQSTLVVAIERAGGPQLQLTGSTVDWYQNGALSRSDTLSTTASRFQWANTATHVLFDFVSKAAGTGALLQLIAGGTAGATGGALDLRSGTGASVMGDVTIRAGSQTVLGYSGSTQRVTIGAALSTTPLVINCGTSTSGTPGGAGPLPDVEGYLDAVVGGVDVRIPYILS